MGLRRGSRAALRLRLQPRPAGQVGPPVHHLVRAERRPHHHARPPELLADAMCGTMHEAGHAMYEQGLSPALDRTPTANWRFTRHARVAVAHVGEPGRPQPALLAGLLSRPAAVVPRAAGQGGSGELLPRPEQGRAVADPHRGRRGHLQPARHAALRTGSGADAGQPVGPRPAGGVEPEVPGVSGDHPARRRPRCAARHPLVVDGTLATSRPTPSAT